MKCPDCNEEYDDSFSYCPYCGLKKPGDSKELEESAAGAATKIGPDKESKPEKPETATHHIGWMPIVAIVVAVMALTGWVIAGIVIGSGTSSSEADTEEVAEKLIQNISDEDYDAIISQIDGSQSPLLGVLISEALGKEPMEVITAEDADELVEQPDVLEFLRQYFASLKKDLQMGNVKSLDSRRLEPDTHYVVAVYTFGSDMAFPLMEISSKDGWKIDLCAMLTAEARGMTPIYVIESVEALLEEPTEETVEKAIKILDATEGLEDYYDLWLQPEAESLLGDEVANDLEEGKKLTPVFDDLRERADKEMEGADSDDTARPETEPIPTVPGPEVQTFTGNGPGLSQVFEIGQGLSVFHFQLAGGNNSVTLLSESGQEISKVIESAGPITGSQAMGVSPGKYLFNVQTTGGWTLGVEEPVPVAAPFPPQTYDGSGYMATPFFQTKGGPMSITMNYRGTGDFVVTIMELNGNAVYLAANETGPYEGAITVSLKSEIYYLFNVESQGPWNLGIQPVEAASDEGPQSNRSTNLE